ncbi:MAG: hypothetical protein JSW31_18655 [Burkholderiales bacterium]|nr:MAG: hypothetical protein JSW31_18655 [Burkholderiales bacterium]
MAEIISPTIQPVDRIINASVVVVSSVRGPVVLSGRPIGQLAQDWQARIRVQLRK